MYSIFVYLSPGPILLVCLSVCLSVHIELPMSLNWAFPVDTQYVIYDVVPTLFDMLGSDYMQPYFEETYCLLWVFFLNGCFLALKLTEKDIHVCQFDNIRVRGILIETMSHVLPSQQTYSRFEQPHAYVQASFICPVICTYSKY